MRFIDTNIFIYVLSKHPKFGETSKSILKRIERGEKTLTNSLVIQEICWYLKAEKKEEKIPEVLQMIRSYIYLKVEPVLFEDILKASKLKKKYKFLKWNECIHLAFIIRKGVEELYSRDEEWDKVDGVERIFK